MALDPRIVLSGIRPTHTPLDPNRLLKSQLLQQNIGLNEQALETGQRTADLADQKQMLIGLQTGVNAFERGDNNGVVKAILATVPPEEQAQELAEFNQDPAGYIGQVKDTLSAFQSQQTGGGLTAGQREFSSLTQGLSAADELKARRVKLRIDAPETGAAAKIFDVGGVPHIFDPVTRKAVPVAVGGEDVTTKSVSESEAIIAARAAQAKGQAAISTGIVKQGFKAVQSINKNMLNLDRAISALRSGAKTGAIEKFLPSIRKASIELDQVRGELGLDVVGAVTFGALSAGELGLAMSVALPTGLDEPALMEHLEKRKDAQSKLLNYYNEQIQFLSGTDQDGTPNTIAQFLSNKEQGAQPDTGISAEQFRAMTPEQRAQALSQLQGQ